MSMKYYNRISSLQGCLQRKRQFPILIRHFLYVLLTKQTNYFKKTVQFFILFFFQGMLNNNTYVLIGTGAQDLAHSFDMDKFMATFQM